MHDANVAYVQREKALFPMCVRTLLAADGPVWEWLDKCTRAARSAGPSLGRHGEIFLHWLEETEHHRREVRLSKCLRIRHFVLWALGPSAICHAGISIRSASPLTEDSFRQASLSL